MSESKTFYKVVPKYIENPKNYKKLNYKEFEDTRKTQIEVGTSLCEGHLETIIWHCDKGYIVQVKVKDSEDSYVLTPCTHEPTCGMDSFDGSLAQDAEVFILINKLGYQSSRLDIFQGLESVDPVEYIKLRGLGEVRAASVINARKDAEFNKLYKVAIGLIDGLMILQGSMNRSLNWFEKRKLNKSLNLFKECIYINPRSWNSMWLLGKAYQSTGNINESLYWFEKAFEVNSNNPDIAREASLQAINLGIPEKAILFAEKAIELNPNEPGLYSNYALALVIGKRGDEALSAINKSIEMNPNDPINISVLKLVRSVVEGSQPYPSRI